MDFASIAWFAQNKAVSADTMAVTAADSPFEIATTGSGVRYETQFAQADPTYQDGDVTTISGTQYHKTGSSTSSLKLRYTPSATTPEIGPGSSGVIEFSIIPKNDGALNVDIELDTIGFMSVKKDGSNTLKKMADVTTTDISKTNAPFTQAQVDKFHQSANYLKGHIMFFREEADDDAQYSYTTPLTDRTLEIRESNVQANVPVPVRIYWMWPKTLGQIALKNDPSNLRRNNKPIVEDIDPEDLDEDYEGSDKEAVVEYLVSEKQNIFASIVKNGEVIPLNDSRVNDMIRSAADNFAELSRGYNTADYNIGTDVEYFLISITVSG